MPQRDTHLQGGCCSCLGMLSSSVSLSFSSPDSSHLPLFLDIMKPKMAHQIRSLPSPKVTKSTFCELPDKRIHYLRVWGAFSQRKRPPGLMQHVWKRLKGKNPEGKHFRKLLRRKQSSARILMISRNTLKSNRTCRSDICYLLRDLLTCLLRPCFGWSRMSGRRTSGSSRPSLGVPGSCRLFLIS